MTDYLLGSFWYFFGEEVAVSPDFRVQSSYSEVSPSSSQRRCISSTGYLCFGRVDKSGKEIGKIQGTFCHRSRRVVGVGDRNNATS